MKIKYTLFSTLLFLCTALHGVSGQESTLDSLAWLDSLLLLDEADIKFSWQTAKPRNPFKQTKRFSSRIIACNKNSPFAPIGMLRSLDLWNWEYSFGELKASGGLDSRSEFQQLQKGSESYSLFYQRTMLYLRAYYKGFTLFSQLKSGVLSGTEKYTLSDKDVLGIHQLFLNKYLPLGFRVRVGRQELWYGSARLLGPQNAANVRRTFDGLQFRYASQNTKTDLLLMSNTPNGFGVFDNRLTLERLLWGIYHLHAIDNWNKKLERYRLYRIELYYLGVHNRRTLWGEKQGQELRHSLGSRLSSNTRLRLDNEATFQFGKFGKDPIRAWSVASTMTYPLLLKEYNHTLGIEASLSSGARGEQVTGFSPLYPEAGYFGMWKWIGGANATQAKLFFESKFFTRKYRKVLKVRPSVEGFWRTSLQDGVYAPEGMLLVANEDAKNAFVGLQTGAVMEIWLGRHGTLGASYFYFKPGDVALEEQQRWGVFLKTTF